MGLHINHEVYVQVATDATANLKLFFPEDEQQTISYDNMTSAFPGTINIAAGGQATLSPGQIQNIAGAYVQVTSACQISVDGGTTWVNLAPAPGVHLAKFFLEGHVPSVALKSPQLAQIPLVGVYCLWGDPPSS